MFTHSLQHPLVFWSKAMDPRKWNLIERICHYCTKKFKATFGPVSRGDRSSETNKLYKIVQWENSDLDGENITSRFKNTSQTFKDCILMILFDLWHSLELLSLPLLVLLWHLCSFLVLKVSLSSIGFPRKWTTFISEVFFLPNVCQELFTRPLSCLFWGQELPKFTLGYPLQQAEGDKNVAGLSQLISFKTTLGTTKCVLLICICDIFEAELPWSCIFSRTTIFPRETGTTVNHMCGREKPVGYVQSLLLLCIASPTPLPPPTYLINDFWNYWLQCIFSEEKKISDRLIGCQKEGKGTGCMRLETRG